MRVGLFLGSFDPIHIGHIAIVTTVLNANLVDKVIIIPAWHNPFKEHNPAPFMKVLPIHKRNYKCSMCSSRRSIT